MNSLIIASIIVAVFLLAVITFISILKKVPRDRALVVTGPRPRTIHGGIGIVIPGIERADQISLEGIEIAVNTRGSLTSQGVPISVEGYALVKIKSEEQAIFTAMERFYKNNSEETQSNIKSIVNNILEGKLREIISEMSVENIYKDRQNFGQKVQDVAVSQLTTMGLELMVFTIKDISDPNEYLISLGKKDIAEVKKNASIETAIRDKEKVIKTTDAIREGEQSKLQNETKVKEAEKEKQLKVYEYETEQQTKKAESDIAYEIRQNKLKQEVKAEEKNIEIVAKKKEIEIMEQERIRIEKELEVTVKQPAEAKKFQEQQKADAENYTKVKEADAEAQSIKLKGFAEAEAIKAKGTAEAEMIRLKGLAEAEAMAKKADAFKEYNDAAITQMIIEKLPEIAGKIAEPLSKTREIVIVDNGNGGQGGGASKVSGYVTDIMASLFPTVEALTGVNMNKVIGDLANKAATPKADTKKIITDKE